MWRVNIYTITNIKGPKKKDGVFGYVLEAETEKGNATCTVFKKIDANENFTELATLTDALKRLNRACEIHVFTQCEYVSGAYNAGWVETWKNNGFKNAKGIEIANRDLWEEMLNLLNGSSISFHVKEHHSYSDWLNSQLGIGGTKCLINLENLTQWQKSIEKPQN